LLFIIVSISTIVYLIFFPKHKNQNRVEIDKQKDKMGRDSFANVYEDINFTEYALEENYEIIRSNNDIELQVYSDDTMLPPMYMEMLH